MEAVGRYLSNAVLGVAGCAAMLIGIAWMSRVSADTAYLTGIALSMIMFGISQGLGLSTLTNAGMAGGAPRAAGAAGGGAGGPTAPTEWRTCTAAECSASG